MYDSKFVNTKTKNEQIQFDRYKERKISKEENLAIYTYEERIAWKDKVMDDCPVSFRLIFILKGPYNDYELIL